MLYFLPHRSESWRSVWARALGITIVIAIAVTLIILPLVALGAAARTALAIGAVLATAGYVAFTMGAAIWDHMRPESRQWADTPKA